MRVAGVVVTLPQQNGTATNLAAARRVAPFEIQVYGFNDTALSTTGAADDITLAGGMVMSATAGRATGVTSAGVTAAQAAAIIGFSYIVVAASQSNVVTQVHIQCI